MINKSFLNFLRKFYSANTLKTEEFKEWKTRLVKIEKDEELIPLLKEIGSNETPESLYDLFLDLKEDERRIEKERGNRIIEQKYKDLRTQVLLQLTLKYKDKATELLVSEFMKEHSVYTTRDDIKSEMWIYKDGVYIPEGRFFVKEFCRLILGEAYTQYLANTVIAKVETDTGIDHEDFFSSATKNIHEIPILNGIFNLKTKKLNKFTPNKIFFNKLPIKYDPSKKCPNIEQHLKDVLKSEDDIKVMYELFGFLLYKDYFIEKAIMLIGNGRNGKGKTIDLMKRFLGIENCASVPLSGMEENSFRIIELFGKMANLAGDISYAGLNNTGTFKGLTGRDVIGGKRKFLNSINFVNYAKIIFACNELPFIKDSTPGFWSRWILFEFPYRFVPKSEYDKLSEKEREEQKIKLMDPNQINKISSENELSGLFNKALEGLDKLKKNKEFSYSKGTEEIKLFWMRKANSFHAFCIDHLEEEYDGKLSKKDVRKAFMNYCKEHKVKGCSDKAMRVVLEEMFGVTDSQLSDENRTRIWEGIKFKTCSKYRFMKSVLKEKKEYY